METYICCDVCLVVFITYQNKTINLVVLYWFLVYHQ